MTSITFGWIAAGLVLLSFYQQTSASLRLVAVLSNLAFIAYATLIGATPILILHLLLLPLNLFRLAQFVRLKRNVQRSAPDSASLNLLVPYMRTYWVRQGDLLFSHGDKADEIFLILNGEIRLTTTNISLCKGHLLGVMGHFTQEGKRTDSAICLTAVQIACITRENLRQAMRKAPAISEMLLCTIAERARKNNVNLSDANAGILMPIVQSAASNGSEYLRSAR